MRVRLNEERVSLLKEAVGALGEFIKDEGKEGGGAVIRRALASELIYTGDVGGGIELLVGKNKEGGADRGAGLGAEDLYILGLAYATQGDNGLALEFFDKATQGDNGRWATASMFFYKGVALGKLDRFEEEEEAYLRALELDPDYFEALYNLGLISEDKGDLGGAVKLFEQCLEAEPQMHLAHKAIGIILGGQGKYQEAAAAFTNSLSINPYCWESWFNLSVALGKMDLIDEAKEALSKIPVDVLRGFVGESVSNSLEEDAAAAEAMVV
jgi:tetratricopeptide (TPR) repeat protein